MPTLPGNFTILIVDDHQNMRRTISDLLRSVGFKSFAYAENGRAALKVLKEQDIHLVVLDWMMPDMNGLEFLRHIRVDKIHQSLPVLMVTAEAASDKVLSAVQLGISDYIVKPFSPDTMFKKIAHILKTEF